MIVNMKENKAPEKKQITEQGYTEIVDRYADNVEQLVEVKEGRNRENGRINAGTQKEHTDAGNCPAQTLRESNRMDR